VDGCAFDVGDICGGISDSDSVSDSVSDSDCFSACLAAALRARCALRMSRVETFGPTVSSSSIFLGGVPKICLGIG
jgi:hypothetical protein